MPDTIRVTFLFAIGDQVRFACSPWPWTIVQRRYHEGSVSRSTSYRLAHTEVMQGDERGILAYEPDLEPWRSHVDMLSALQGGDSGDQLPVPAS